MESEFFRDTFHCCTRGFSISAFIRSPDATNDANDFSMQATAGENLDRIQAEISPPPTNTCNPGIVTRVRHQNSIDNGGFSLEQMLGVVPYPEEIFAST